VFSLFRQKPCAGWAKASGREMDDILEFLLPREQYCVPFTSRLAKQGVKFYSAFFETADMFIERANGNICSAVLLSNEGFLFPVFTKQSFPDAVAALLKHSRFYKKRFLTIMGLKSDVISLEGNLSSEKVISVDYHLLTARSENVKAAAGNYLQNKSLSKIPGLKVRHASAEDIDTLMPLRKAYEIEEVVFDPGSYNESSSRKRFLNTIKTTKVLFAESRGPIATCCINAEGFSWAQIGGVYTVPGKRSLGISARLMAELSNYTAGNRKDLTLFVKKDNLPAARLYSNCGFSLSGDFRISYLERR
jgi:GNAT superfamily N-acetyltransferase